MEERIFSKYARILNRFVYPDINSPLIHHEYVLVYLRQIQNWVNERLKARGHVSIIEVYELLGLSTDDIIDSTDGWTYGESDSYIDFGIYDPCNKDFINGLGDVIVLDFNVD